MSIPKILFYANLGFLILNTGQLLGGLGNGLTVVTIALNAIAVYLLRHAR